MNRKRFPQKVPEPGDALDGFPESKMELTAWVERSERGVAIIGTFEGEVTTLKDSSFTRYFPSKAASFPGIFDTFYRKIFLNRVHQE